MLFNESKVSVLLDEYILDINCTASVKKVDYILYSCHNKQINKTKKQRTIRKFWKVLVCLLL